MVDRTMATYSHWTTFGFRPHHAPHSLLQAHNKLVAFHIFTSTCSLQVNAEPTTTASYLAETEYLIEPHAIVVQRNSGVFLS
jgi:hypothetical protein